MKNVLSHRLYFCLDSTSLSMLQLPMHMLVFVQVELKFVLQKGHRQGTMSLRQIGQVTQ